MGHRPTDQLKQGRAGHGHGPDGSQDGIKARTAPRQQIEKDLDGTTRRR